MSLSTASWGQPEWPMVSPSMANWAQPWWLMTSTSPTNTLNLLNQQQPHGPRCHHPRGAELSAAAPLSPFYLFLKDFWVFLMLFCFLFYLGPSSRGTFFCSWGRAFGFFPPCSFLCPLLDPEGFHRDLKQKKNTTKMNFLQLGTNQTV